MCAIKVEYDLARPTTVYYRKGNGKKKKLCTLTRGETARRASKYKVIVTRGHGAMLYDLKTGTAKSISKDDKIGSRFVP